jgi:hypothetical protein
VCAQDAERVAGRHPTLRGGMSWKNVGHRQQEEPFKEAISPRRQREQQAMAVTQNVTAFAGLRGRLWGDERVSSFQLAEAGEVAVSAQQFAHAVLNTQCCNPPVVYARSGYFAPLDESRQYLPVCCWFG